MKLEHIALTVKSREEIDDFYCGILGLKKIRDFVLKADVAGFLFGLNAGIEVSFLEKDGMNFELFVAGKLQGNQINHVCISVPDREASVKMADAKGYTVMRIKRPEFDLVFLKDKSGNLFELRTLSN